MNIFARATFNELVQTLFIIFEKKNRDQIESNEQLSIEIIYFHGNVKQKLSGNGKSIHVSKGDGKEM